jgi:hypothetical protein
MFKIYDVTLELTREMLGTNPIDPNVMDNHIIDRQRKLIAENSTINKAIDKYLKAIQISDESKEMELAALRATAEEIYGDSLTDEQFDVLISKGFKGLKETLVELDIKGITCFFRNPSTKKVCIGSHMISGFLKASADSISKTLPKKNGTILHSRAYTCEIINQHISFPEHLIDATSDIIRDDLGNPVYLQRSLRAMTAQGQRISLAKSEQLPVGTQFNFKMRILNDSPIKEEHLDVLFNYGQVKGLGQWRNAGYGQFKVINFTLI